MARHECPCGSGRRYGDCCRPLHRGEREAADAVALMRSRFAAFALNEADYLWHTLAPEHVDRQQARETVLRGIRESASRYRYRSLSILDTRQPDPKGVARVLFLARVFRDGQEVSFVELSEFTHDGVGWRYAGGTLQPVEDVAGDPAALRIATFQS